MSGPTCLFDGREGQAHNRAMPIPSDRRAWRAPPILLQILLLLGGGLVVAQAVTLLLTMMLPPAPPAQHRLGDVAAALRGASAGDLTRTVQAGPPAIDGAGWFTSPESRTRLAGLLGAREEAVRLAFYAPLPFAGTAAPPPRGAAVPVAWRAADGPIVSRASPIRPIALLIEDGPPPGGGGGPGGPGSYPGGGFPGAGFPGGGFPRGGATGGPGGFPGARPGGAFGRDRGGMGGRPSPRDLDRQPIAPPRAEGAPAAAPGGGPPSGFGRLGYPGGRVPTEGLDPRMFETITPAAPAPAPLPPPEPDAATPEPPRAARAERAEAPAPAPAAAAPAPVASAPAAPPRAVAAPREAAPVPIAPQGRALFGLAPAPFVEGDFVAGLRLPDGRWAVVQPRDGFPSAWQKRVALWFAIAFALVAPVGWLFARAIVRPLARFTAAAELLGRDPAAALVPLAGPAEIGRAARAFNVMRARLVGFVDDRTAMVGAISHDLRTPLTRLRFRIEEIDDDRLREGIGEEIAEMEAMIASVLAFIRDASTPNPRERLDLGLIVEDVAQDAAMVGGDVTVESVSPAPVEVDVLGMRRLLANLVENAVKYGLRARIRVEVGEEAVVAVHDDGPGVPEDELERAFEPFYRASNAEGSGKPGSGLGLAVCRSIARAHGGDVRLARSEEGFAAVLRLPLAFDAARLAA